MKASSISKHRAPVLNVYFKVFKKNLPMIIIYIGVFMLLAVMFTRFGTNSSTIFRDTKSKVAFINYDSDTPLTAGLKSAISGNAEFISVKDDTQSLQDALYFRNVEYLIKIPKGFTEDFMSGGNAKIDKTAVAESAAGVYMDNMVNRYLNTVRLFQKSLPGLTQEQLITHVKSNLSQQADVTLNTYGTQASSLTTISNYFIYLVYAFFSILFLCVSSIMIVFNDEDRSKRMICSPLHPESMKAQVFLGHILLTVFICACGIALGILTCGLSVIGSSFALMCVNALILAFTVLSISFFCSEFIKNYGALNFIANVLALGTCFVSGVFIPQALLSSSLLSVARFTPSYWYVKAITDITNISVINFTTVRPILYSILIELGFAVAFTAMSFAVGKRKNRFG